MLVPQILCGDAKAVAAACRRHVTQFQRGSSWLEVGPMCDVCDAAGLIMLDGPSPSLAGEQIRLYAPFREFYRTFEDDVASLEDLARANVRAFDEAVTQPWAVLGLLSMACYVWLDDRERAERFLSAMMQFWHQLDAPGSRYTVGEQHGKSLWELPHLLKYVLAHRGVSTPRLLAPLPAGGIAKLLQSSN